MRPKKPSSLIDYEKWIDAGPPKFCHNCEYYSRYGDCTRFNMRPPPEFANTEGACKFWEMEVPF